MGSEKFAEWLKRELESKHWRQADLAKATHLDSAVISNLINGKRGPGIDTCNTIARALDLPLETVYRAAGILPLSTEETLRETKMKGIFKQLSEEDQDELIQIAAFKLDKQKARKA